MPPVPSITPPARLDQASHLIRRASSSISHTTSSLISWLTRRQSTTTVIPADYSNIDSSQPPGTIIGIVIGSVAGFLLILWLIYTLMGGNIYAGRASSDVESVVIREHKRSRRGSSRRGSSRRESFEVREVREVRRPPVVDRIVVEERRESRPPPPVAVVVEESSVGSDDEVIVIEEHSPPRRASSAKKSKESGYRTVDPLAYGGGDRPLRDVDRRGSRRSNR